MPEVLDKLKLFSLIPLNFCLKAGGDSFIFCWNWDDVKN